MSTTTQILFNSPALHSLKRDQLVKLCKIHSIKANGKNVELVERLKSHAKSLPRDSPLSVAFRSEQEGAPVAQDDDEAETSQEQKAFHPDPARSGSFNNSELVYKSTGLFLGLKRHATGGSTSTRGTPPLPNLFQASLLIPLPPPSATTDELLKNSTPYHALPPPSLEDLQTDHFTFDTTDPAVVAANLNPTLGTAPLPGHTLRPGVPAPVNARLSLGIAPRTPSKQGPTTTIRLVSFGSLANATTFDLDLGSPTAAPAFPESLYPALPASPPMDDTERRMSLEASMGADDDDVPMPGAFAFGGEPSTPKTVKPFPDAATKAKLAAEVMKEMNRRVFGEGGVPHTPPASRAIRPLGSAKKGGAESTTGGGRFDKAHEQVSGRWRVLRMWLRSARSQEEVERNKLKPKPAPSRGRFGFFAGAAKLVQGVWGKKATPAPPLAPKPAAAASSSSKTQKLAASAKPPTALDKMGPPAIPSVASTNAKSLRPPSMRSVTSTRSTAAGCSRSPLPPSFAPSTASSKATASSVRTRNSSIAGASSVGTRTSSAASSMGARSSLRVGSLGTRGSISSTNTPSSTVDSAHKTASRPSRLLAPTASSLAKMNGSPSPGALAAVQEKPDTKVLDAITNTAGSGAEAGATTVAPGKTKGKLLPAPGRKPRISRSRVIAKLASQRVASGSSIASTSTAASSRKSLGGTRVRSSLGAKVQRGSLGGMKNGPSAVLDAKKRARQSEYYARRKSRVEPDAMNVDS
ncbi:hypothetical protein B0H13DRAFT_2542616 [Mycena leptocephala]|nr:hypothetical protein B0H13DRAFT_2542616 [Mycena leptocephala]